MAKKRLNKKVAFVGFIIFIVFALGATATILYLSRDPQKWARDGDTALAAKDYEKAATCYLKARAYSKSDDFRIKMLSKLVDLYIATDKWRNVIGCWKEIIRLDPKNVKSRYGQLEYFYIVADSGAGNLWQEIDLQASQFIDLAESQKLLNENLSKWATAGLPKSALSTDKIGSYLYVVRGRALMERARLGAATDPEELFSRSVSDLEKVLQLEPNNVDAYWYLAQAYIARGEIYASKGNPEGKAKALEQAKELLEKPVKTGTDNLQAHINLLAMKPVFAQMSDREQFKKLEPEYLSLVEKFDSSAKSHSAAATFYTNLGYKYLDKAISQIDKARELDKENVSYAISAAGLYYRKSSIFGDNAILHKAMDIAQQALRLPGAMDTKGPQQWTNKSNGIWLNSFLANCYVEQILNPTEQRTDAQKQELLANTEKAIHQIEQFYGSGEEPTVVKWQGILELANGNRQEAVRKLVPIYEQMKAAGQRDTLLSYTLAKLFEDSDEIGAATDFFGSALSVADRSVANKIDDSKPEALLDYAALLLKLRQYDNVVNVVDYYEHEYWTKPRSRAIRIEAYIGGRHFDEAQKELAKGNPEDPNTIKLGLLLTKAEIGQVRSAIMRRQMEKSSDIWQQMVKTDAEMSAAQTQNDANNAVSVKAMSDELRGYTDTLARSVEKLLAVEPNSVGESSVVLLCDRYISESKINEARAAVDKYLEYFPNNLSVLVYKRILSEPEPNNISVQKRSQIEKEVISAVPDPVARATYLGAYFQRNNDPNKAAEEYKKILGIVPLKEKVIKEPVFNAAEKPTQIQRMAASSLANLALKAKDAKLAEQVTEIGKQGNLDDCDGKFFEAVVAMIKQDYKEALASVDECLKMRPDFSYAYMLRSNIDSFLENEHASVTDMQKAAALNPMDGTIARALVGVLYQRNQKLGDNVTSEQVVEARTALDRAMVLNPDDLQLLGFYSEYISDTDPLRALAIRQALQKITPSAQNSFLLGKMAMKVAGKQTDPSQKNALYAVAASSLQQALTYEPGNQAVLGSLAEYYRTTGQDKKAEELLVQTKEPQLLWRHFLMSGQPDRAKELLLQLYAKDPNNGDILKGLTVVAENLGDRVAVMAFSDKLVKVDDTSQNRLLQVQILLHSGLLKEAENRLQSFKEKYPNDPKSVQLDGWLAMKQGRLPEAMALVNKNLELNQDDPAAWQLRGEINYLMANYDAAVDDLKRSRAISDKPDVRISLAKALLRIGRGEDALTELEVLANDPKAPMEGTILLEEIYSKVGKTKSLVSLYRKVLENYPDNLLWYDRAGKFALSVNDFNSAATVYEKGWLKSNKTDKDMLDGYLQSLLAAGKVDKTIEEAKKYVDGDLAPVALYRIADAKMKLGDKAEAVQYCRKAMEKASGNENASSWILEKINALLGQDEVLSVCKEKLRVDPNSPSANFAMYNVMKLNGEYNKALDYIEKCLSYVDPNSDAESGLMTRKVEILQQAYLKTSDNNYRDKAIAEYKSLLAKQPNNVEIMNNLAYLLAEANQRLAEALKYAKRANETAPNNAGFMDTYGYLLYKNKQYPKAAELLQAAIQQYEQGKTPVPSDVYEHLAMVKEALGQTAEARSAYEQSLDAGAKTLSNAEKERIKEAIKQLSQ